MKPKNLSDKEKEVGLDYTTEKFLITAKNIGQFKLIENRRYLRESHAKQIKRALLEGVNFDAPIIINQVKDQKRIIDGQHRITAIKEILETFPKFKVWVTLFIYSNLTKQQEQNLFSKINRGMRQSSDDYVMMYFDEIPILEEIKADVTIYKKPDKMHFKPLLEGYLFAQKKGRLGISREEFIDKVSHLDKEDSKKIKEFIKGFKEHVLTVNNSDYLKTTPLCAILFTYFNTTLQKKDYWERIKINVLENEKFLLFTRMGGHTATQVAIDTIKDLLDRPLKQNEHSLKDMMRGK